MLRIFSIAALISLIGATSFAGMTPEQMKKRMEEIQKQLTEIALNRSVITAQSIVVDQRDLDRRQFESDLELARVNARREVILIRAKEEEARRQTENEVLKRRLDTIAKQRGVVQSDLAKTSEKVDAGQMPPQEVTALKLQLIKLDEEAATVEFQMSGGGSRFSDALADIEVDLAGINAVRKVLAQRKQELTDKFQGLSATADTERKLGDEFRLLVQEYERITGTKP